MAEEQRLSAVIELKDNISANINKMSTNFAQFIKRTSALDPILQKTDTATKRTGRAFDELGVKVGKTKSSLSGLRSVYNTSLRVKDYATGTIRKVKAEATAFGGKVYTATMAMRDATGPAMGKVKNKLSGAAAGLTMGVPVQMLGMAGVGLGVSDAISTFKSFEAQMSRVRGISGATAEEAKQLTAAAREAGATTQFSATESAKALEYMAMAGWKSKESIAALPGVLNLASASGEDLALVSDIVTDAMTAFHMDASRAGEFADVLAVASSNSNTNVAKMGYTFKYVAPVAGALGYKIQDVAVAIGAMADTGIKGEQAGTSLRTILTNMVAPTGEAEVAMSQLGLSVKDSSGKMKPFRTLLTDLRKSFQGLDKSQKSQYAAMLAGKEGMSGLLAIVDKGDESFNKLVEAIDNANGRSKQMAEIMNDNLAGDMKSFSSKWDEFMLELFMGRSETGLGAQLRNIVKEANSVLEEVTNSIKNGGGIGTAVSTLVKRVVSDTMKSLYEFDGSLGTWMATIAATAVTYKAGKGLWKMGRVGYRTYDWLKGRPGNKKSLPGTGSSGLPGISDMTVNAATVYVNGSVVPGTDSGVSPGGKKSPGKTSVPREAPIPAKPRSRWRIGVDATKKVGGYALKPVKAVAKRVGWLPVIAGAYQIATAQPGQRMQATANVAGGLAGAWAGGKAGAAIGGAVGSAFGGVGAIPGAAIGGVLGSIGGYMGGEALMENWSSVTDWISKKTKEAGDKAVENYRQSQSELSSITEETNSKEAQMADLRAQAWKGAWESVKSVWGECQGWFDANVWQPLVSAVNSAKESIISAFSDAVAGVKAVWQGITGWFEENIIGPLRSKFNTLSTLASGISMPSELGGSGGSLLKGTYSFFSSEKSPKRNALGTMYFTGGLTTINEHGEELIDLAGGSRIYPAGQTKRIIRDEVRSLRAASYPSREEEPIPEIITDRETMRNGMRADIPAVAGSNIKSVMNQSTRVMPERFHKIKQAVDLPRNYMHRDVATSTGKTETPAVIQTKEMLSGNYLTNVLTNNNDDVTSNLFAQDTRSFQVRHSDDASQRIEDVKSTIQPEQLPVLQVPSGPAQRSKGDIKLSISGNTFIVREKADIDEVVYKLYRLIAEGAGNFGGEVSV